jgi:hypothetical protein
MLETWRDVVGFEGLYAVSSQGRVKSLPRTVIVHGTQQQHKIIKERILKQTINVPAGRAYTRYMVGLCKEGKRITRNVARLVAEAFVPNPNKYPCVLHRDDNALNNAVSNLEWGTLQENSRQAAERGRTRSGEAHHSSVVSNAARQEAYNLLLTGIPVSRVATLMAMPHQAVTDLRDGKIKGYKSLQVTRLVLRGSKCPQAKLTEQHVIEIKQSLANGRTHTSIAAQFGVSKSAIAAIGRGATWAWL